MNHLFSPKREQEIYEPQKLVTSYKVCTNTRNTFKHYPSSLLLTHKTPSLHQNHNEVETKF